MEYVSRAARAGPRASERWGPYDGQNLSRSIIFYVFFFARRRGDDSFWLLSRTAAGGSSLDIIRDEKMQEDG